jgi:hypothetical protein
VFNHWAFASVNDGVTPIFSGSPTTLLDMQTFTGGTTYGYASTYNIQTTAADSTPQINLASQFNGAANNQLVFPAAGGGGGGGGSALRRSPVIMFG